MNEQDKPLEESESEWFVNRSEYLDYFWDWATSVPLVGRHSIAFAGLRRTGKTAIIHRVFNRLFNEQDRVIPIYISFARYLHRPEPITTYEFAEDYFSGYVRSYLAFRYRRPDLLSRDINFEYLHEEARQIGDEYVLELFRIFNLTLNGGGYTPSVSLAHWIIDFPKGDARLRKMPMAIFIDEFQLLTRVINSDTGHMTGLTNAFQHASETHWAPITVSGSSVNLLLGEATGGSLSGRLRYQILGPLDQGHAIDMIYRLADHLGINMPDEFALAIWRLTQGYPYAIESLMLSESPEKANYPDPDALDEVLRFELTHPSGLLFEHYTVEFTKYSTLLNEGETTKKVMFWATKYPDERIDTELVAKEIGVSPQEVQASLQKLEQLDIVRRVTWSLYHGPTDPMLKRYIAYQYAYEIQGLSEAEAGETLQRQINRDRGKESNVIGKMAEAIVGGVMRGFDGRVLDGATYFSTPELVTVPKFSEIEQRWGVIEEGIPNELDLIGEYKLPYDAELGKAPQAAWLVQVKYRKRTTSKAEVEGFIDQVKAVQSAKGYAEMTLWYISKGGYTEEAAVFLSEEGIYCSTLSQFNRLAQAFGFLGWPE